MLAWVAGERMTGMAQRRSQEVSREKVPLELALSGLLGREIALDDLLRMLVDQIVAGVGADRGTLFLLDAARGELFSRVAHLPELSEIRLKIGQGVAGHVALTGAPVVVGSTRDERRFFTGVDRQTGYFSQSLLAVPMRDQRGRVIGVLQLLNKKVGAFNSQDEQRAVELASQAAKVLETTSLYPELRRAELDPAGGVSYCFNHIIGQSEPMQAVYRATEKAAATLATVLIRGESGTGKELIARAIQVNGSRREKPFVKVDCAALPANLIENELFGHERGAFTGANMRSEGKFEAARGGTVFIDEIGELPLAVQGKILRVLQDRQFERVGGNQTVTADVRIIAATHRDLETLVARGQFRPDLYYRIRVLEIRLPALRARGNEDLRRLVNHFASLSARKHRRPVPELSSEAWERLERHSWPGNVRELEHCIESAVIMSEGRIVQPGELSLPSVMSRPGLEVPAEVCGSLPDSARSQTGGVHHDDLTLETMERRHLQRVLELSGGNRTQAARRLGIGRNTLIRKIKEHGLEP